MADRTTRGTPRYGVFVRNRLAYRGKVFEFTRATIVPSVLSIILLLALGRLAGHDDSWSAFVMYQVIVVCLILIWGSLTRDRPRRTIRKWRPVDSDDGKA
jgi:hypothetical protein